MKNRVKILYFFISLIICTGGLPFSCLCNDTCLKCSHHTQNTESVPVKKSCCEKKSDVYSCEPKPLKTCECQCWISKTNVYDRHNSRFSGIITSGQSLSNDLYLHIPEVCSEDFKFKIHTDFSSYQQVIPSAVPVYLLNLSILC